MKLLIDVGNTLIKWALFEGDLDAWHANGRFGHHELDHQLSEIVRKHQPERALGVCVAGQAIAQRIDKALRESSGCTIEWFRSSTMCCGVRNAYEYPEQLGADRWAALIGAHALHRGPALVVCAGTATTVDLLDQQGDFLGGIIIPGERLMRSALAGNTAQLPLADGHYREHPRNTVDAIVSGCAHAQAGAIERMYQHIADQPEACCLLSGGAADALAPRLTVPLRRIDNLVLHGLRVVAIEGVPEATAGADVLRHGAQHVAR